MSEISQASNELAAAAAELALVTPHAETHPEEYERARTEWERANEAYLAALTNTPVVAPPPQEDPSDPVIDDDEDYDEDEEAGEDTMASPVEPSTNNVSGVGGRLDFIEDDQAEVHADTEGQTFGPKNPYRFEDLTQESVPTWWTGRMSEDDYFAFKQRVYRRCVERAAARRSFYYGIPQEQIGRIEGLQFRKELVDDASNLLAAAREALAADQASGDPAASQATGTIGLASAYRSADTQFRYWNGRFTGTYAERHHGELDALGGSPLSDAWVELLARKIGAATATPGYSLHQRGIALDFRNPEPGIKNSKTKK